MHHISQSERQDEDDDEEQRAFLPPSSSSLSPREDQIPPEFLENEHEDEDEDEDKEMQQRARPVRSARVAMIWRYARLVLELVMAVTIIGLAVAVVGLPLQGEGEDQMPGRKTPVPRLPRKIYRFAEDQKYLHEAMFGTELDTLHTLHNWIELSSASRGYVVIDNYESYDDALPEPYTVQVNRTSDGPGFMVSVFHQLHCLSYLVQHYQAGYGGTALTQEVAHHAAHCFDYLRQAIMCAGDTSLEGKTAEGPGWGSEHECVDYDALLAWANGHAAMKWHLVPQEGVL